MRKITLLIISAGIALFAIHSCKKSDINGNPSGKGLVLGSYLVLDSAINENLNFSDPSATVSIKVGSKGSPIATVKIFVATGSNSADSTGWVSIKSVPYTEGVVLSVSTAELNTALATVNQTIAPGNQYTLQNVVVTSDGRTFSVTNTPTNFVSLTGYNMALTWSATAVCAFDQASSIGVYKVVTDTWVDYSPGDTINVFAGPDAHSLSFYGYPGAPDGGINRVPWIVEVDPATGAATVADQFVGDYGTTVARVSATGFIFSCTGGISLIVNVNYGGAPYAGQVFVLQKQ